MKRGKRGLLILPICFILMVNSYCYSEDIRKIAEKTKEIVEEFYTTGATEVFKQIERNLKALDEIINLVENAKDINAVIDDVIERLEEITVSYEKIARMRPQIEEDLRKQIGKLREMLRRSRNEIENLKREKMELQSKLNNVGMITDPDIRTIKRKSLEARIKLKEKQIQIWQGFLEIQENIRKAVEQADRTITKFLIVLEENGKVYREALNVVKLQRDIQRAAESMVNIAEIGRLTDAMISSWQDFQHLIEMLTVQMGKLPPT